MNNCTCTDTCARRGKPFPVEWSWRCQGFPYVATELDMHEKKLEAPTSKTVAILEQLRRVIERIPVRHEPISGQMFSYIKLSEVLAWVDIAVAQERRSAVEATDPLSSALQWTFELIQSARAEDLDKLRAIHTSLSVAIARSPEEPPTHLTGLASQIDYAQRVVAEWPNSVRVAMGLQVKPGPMCGKPTEGHFKGTCTKPFGHEDHCWFPNMWTDM